MAVQGTRISFVIGPDGELDENSLTHFGEQTARRAFISRHLPGEWVGHSSQIVDDLWQCARRKGFRSYTIEVAADGKPTLSH
jgi:hypothetical protein